jgi:phenylacetate-coenzyme A ligase PaaK-like adenylate-forming protein
MGYVRTEPCRCRRTSTRLYFLGQVGYRVTVRDQLIFPVEIQRVMQTFAEVDHGLFQIVRYAEQMGRLQLRIGYRHHEVPNLEALSSRLVQSFEQGVIALFLIA